MPPDFRFPLRPAVVRAMTEPPQSAQNNRVRPVIVAISGGTGAGKTTFAKIILRELKRQRVTIIPEDNYYFDMPKEFATNPFMFNFDSIESKNHNLLSQFHNPRRAGSII